MLGSSRLSYLWMNHDELYCLITDPWLYTTFSDALLDTMSGLLLNTDILRIQIRLQNRVFLVLCTIVQGREPLRT